MATQIIMIISANRPHLSTCIKQLYTEHEDIEICRCIWRYTATKCTSHRSKYFFQNWAKNVPLGGIGYKTNIDPTNDLTNYIIDSAIVMHAVKNPATHTEIRKRVLTKRIANHQVSIQLRGHRCVIIVSFNFKSTPALKNHVNSIQNAKSRDATKKKVTTSQVFGAINNCTWNHVALFSKKYFRYKTDIFPVRKAEPYLIDALRAINAQVGRVYAKHHNYFYICRNQRGFTMFEAGGFKRKTSSKGVKLKAHSETRQYLTTVQFDKVCSCHNI